MNSGVAPPMSGLVMRSLLPNAAGYEADNAGWSPGATINSVRTELKRPMKVRGPDLRPPAR